MTAPRFVITGPTGWIGMAMLAVLAERLGPGWADRTTLFGSTARQVTAPDGSVIAMRALANLTPADVDGAHVVHLAYLGKEQVALVGERRFTDTNLAIDDHVLAAIGAAAPASLFVASSGAAALAASGRDRHPYGMGKLRQEDRFLARAAASGVPTICGRIFNVAGPHINKTGSYAIAVFIGQARDEGTIRIEAAVPVFRSYLHVCDLAAIIFEAAKRGIDRTAPVDLCGFETVEMSDIAATVASQMKLTTPILRHGVDWSRPNAYLGSFCDTKILAMQTDVPLVPFLWQVADTIRWLEVARR